MYQASDNSLTSYVLMVRPQKDCPIKGLPSAFHVFRGLEQIGIQSGIEISDLLPDRYLYKPIILDMANISSEKQFLQFKKVKKVKYVHEDLFSDCFAPETILRGIERGDIIISDQFMSPAHEKDRFVCRQQCRPDHDPPIVYCLAETDLFNIRVRSEKEALSELAKSPRLLIDGTEYVIGDIQQMEHPSSGDFMVLQASGIIRRDYHRPKDLTGFFKLGLEQTDKTQFFRAGSMLDRATASVAIQNAGFTPFAMYGGIKS